MGVSSKRRQLSHRCFGSAMTWTASKVFGGGVLGFWADSARFGQSAAVMTQNRHCRQLGTRPGGTSVARHFRMLVSRSVSLAQFKRPWALGQLLRTGTSRSWNVLR